MDNKLSRYEFMRETNLDNQKVRIYQSKFIINNIYETEERYPISYTKEIRTFPFVKSIKYKTKDILKKKHQILKNSNFP